MSTFHPFPKLPLELRLAIWEMTVEPREVEVRIKAQQEWKPYRPYVHMVSSIVPPALHTCREARNHGLYQPISLHADAQHADHRYVWLNLDIDVINIGTSYLAHFEPVAPAIKRLKLSRENTDERWSEYEKDLLLIFVNVKKIYVICIDGFWNWGDDDVYNYPWPCAYENLVFIDENSPMGYLEAGYREVDEYLGKWRAEDFSVIDENSC
ncbi:hypothetical protein BKA66DRAFT_408755 [Pyrenochaeta sp. MPI-SDFR-AT-0127]|nr:hypothetical protein BKA66DRAFT_408755 [Pyrenochaeta sp. MPI-SDFR-AT-0127]